MQWVTTYVTSSAWQAAILALCAQILVWVTRRGGARLHYWLWVSALLLCVAAPAMPTILLQKGLWLRRQPEKTVRQLGVTIPVRAEVKPLPILIDTVTTPLRESGARPLILWAYVLTVLTGLLKLLCDLWQTHALVRRAPVFELPEPMASDLNRVRVALRVGPITVRRTTELQSPATVNWPRAILLVPENFAACSAAQAAAAMGHEMSHVRRRDFWTNLICELVAVAAFWHPAVHWMKRRIAEAREICCDDLAATVTDGPAAYAGSLLSLVEGVATGHRKDP